MNLFIQELVKGNFFVDYVISILDFFKTIEEEEASNIKAVSSKKSNRKLPPYVIHFCQQIPLVKGGNDV